MTTDAGVMASIDAVLRGIKDFQRDTVEYVFRRLYKDEDQVRRFLVADEVGLGKTLVAKGVIALAIQELQQQKVQRIDIVYVCSSQEIARQNVRRLNFLAKDEPPSVSRITLLPLEFRNLKATGVNFVAFTPGTSFGVSEGTGWYRERVVLAHLVKLAWGEWPAGAVDVFCDGVSSSSFERKLKHFLPKNLHAGLSGAFKLALGAWHTQPVNLGARPLEEWFRDLCARSSPMPERDTPVWKTLRREQRDFVKTLRALLASTCMRELQPDLVILDEFQRFTELLGKDTPAAELAHELFNYQEGAEKARVILLSATPYRMYTRRDEEGGDRHHEEFLHTLRFLMEHSPEGLAHCKQLLGNANKGIARGEGWDVEVVAEAASALAAELRKVMVRTERLGQSEDRDGMLQTKHEGQVRLTPEEVSTYLGLQKVGRALKHAETMEFWKSSPYLLSFMEGYALKKQLAKKLRHTAFGQDLQRVLSQHDGLQLPSQSLHSYTPLDPGNARMRWLHHRMIGSGAWRLLWVPPSHPTYQLSGAFGEARQRDFTKALVFSSWRVVPKAIAGLLSYEAEREMIRSNDRKGEKTVEDRKEIRPPLPFAESKERLTGMMLFTLFYPSVALARIGDPFRGSMREPRLEDVEAAVGAELTDRLAPLVKNARPTGAVDKAWFWAAPLLLDLEEDPEGTLRWFAEANLADTWLGTQADEGSTHWAKHVARLAGVIKQPSELGRAPDLSELVGTLTKIAIGAPATSALRALGRTAGGVGVMRRPLTRTAAAQVGLGFRSLFNVPEVIMLLRGLSPVRGDAETEDETYWERVLDYCVQGGLSAVLDEYAHVLKDSLGLSHRPKRDIIVEIAKVMAASVSVRAARIGTDQIGPDPEDGKMAITQQNLRVRFAMRFGNEQEEEQDTKRNDQAVDEEPAASARSRAETVRAAFNSPFWPFVLASTSVGQEGLDFHPYCHAVIHWNLPGNPVDLEQREGRVHRFKGHAVRKNVARVQGACVRVPEGGDPWVEMFAEASRTKPAGRSDLVPYWVYPTNGGSYIERHVPMLPVSRDGTRLRELRRSLVAYRMVFGQPRQEDLLAHLLGKVGEAELRAAAERVRIDLSPPPGAWREEPVPAGLPHELEEDADGLDAVVVTGLSGGRSSKAWTQEQFYQVLTERCGAEDAAAYERLLAWAEARGAVRVLRKGSLAMAWRRGRREYKPLRAYVNGSVEVVFENLKVQRPFDRRALRLEMLERLNAVPGVVLEEKRLGTRPSFEVGVLGSEEGFGGVVGVLEWFVAQLPL